MNKLIAIGVLAGIAAGAYYIVNSTRTMDGGGLSADAAATALKTSAEVINASGDMKYDDFSRLTSAKADGMTLTVAGRSTLDAAKLSDNYLDTRKAQARNKLCNDEATKAILGAGATYIYNWASADGETIGTVTADPSFCQNGS